MNANPRTRPGQQARPGDATGRKREALAREHSEELKAREGEIALINAERSRSASEDVLDLEERSIIKPDGSVIKMDDEPEDAPRIIGTGDTRVEELPDVVEPTKPGDPSEKVVIRVNADLEDVTFGYGNTYTFTEGRRYRVPVWIAEHLEDRGLVWGRG